MGIFLALAKVVSNLALSAIPVLEIDDDICGQLLHSYPKLTKKHIRSKRGGVCASRGLRSAIHPSQLQQLGHAIRGVSLEKSSSQRDGAREAVRQIGGHACFSRDSRRDERAHHTNIRIKSKTVCIKGPDISLEGIPDAPPAPKASAGRRCSVLSAFRFHAQKGFLMPFRISKCTWGPVAFPVRPT